MAAPSYGPSHTKLMFNDYPFPRLQSAVWPSAISIDSATESVHHHSPHRNLSLTESCLPHDFSIIPGCRPVFPKPLARSSNGVGTSTSVTTASHSTIRNEEPQGSPNREAERSTDEEEEYSDEDRSDTCDSNETWSEDSQGDDDVDYECDTASNASGPEASESGAVTDVTTATDLHSPMDGHMSMPQTPLDSRPSALPPSTYFPSLMSTDTQSPTERPTLTYPTTSEKLMLMSWTALDSRPNVLPLSTGFSSRLASGTHSSRDVPTPPHPTPDPGSSGVLPLPTGFSPRVALDTHSPTNGLTPTPQTTLDPGPSVLPSRTSLSPCVTSDTPSSNGPTPTTQTPSDPEPCPFRPRKRGRPRAKFTENSLVRVFPAPPPAYLDRVRHPKTYAVQLGALQWQCEYPRCGQVFKGYEFCTRHLRAIHAQSEAEAVKLGVLKLEDAHALLAFPEVGSQSHQDGLTCAKCQRKFSRPDARKRHFRRCNKDQYGRTLPEEVSQLFDD